MDPNKGLKYFNKASEILETLNTKFLTQPAFWDDTTAVQDNQSMAILAIKYGLDYQSYINYIDKFVGIIGNKALIADIRKFKGLIAEIEKYKDQIDLVDLVSKAARNNSISKLTKVLRNELKKEVTESKLLTLEQEEKTLASLIKPEITVSKAITQQPDVIPDVPNHVQHEITCSEPSTSSTTLDQTHEQITASVTIDYQAVAIQAKSNEIAHHLQHIFQKTKSAAKKAIWHKLIPSWLVDDQKYTAASPEVIGIWDNVYAIIFPKLLLNMSSKLREQCENAFYKGYANRFIGSNGFKLIEKLVWELKCNSDIRWAVKSKNVDVLTKSVFVAA